jgi:hypothetical protein
LIIGPAVFDGNVLALDKAGIVQALPEPVDVRRESIGLRFR